MSRKNAVKIKTLIAESSGYHFKSATDDSSYVIASKHGLCQKADDCTPFNEGDSECCKSCDVELDLSSCTLNKKGKMSLSPSKVYSFPSNDIAIIQVEEKSSTPLRIGTLTDGEGSYAAFGYKSDSMATSRLLLNNPEIEGEECYFNLESSVVTELVEKSESLVGLSGSIVVNKNNCDIPVAYSIITTNEESNDVLGELLHGIDFQEMETFFGSTVFAKRRCKVGIDTSFKKHFKTISIVPINDKLKLSVLIPCNKGFPYFNLNPIAKSLTSEFETILGHNTDNKSMLTVSALRVLEQKKELQPAYKLLASRIVESMMNAPHIYSTYIDHTHYHHVHLMNDSEAGAEFIVSSYGGEGNLSDQLNYSLGQMLHHLNHYAFDASLISERAFLDVKYSQEECEALYEILFGEHDDVIRNLSIMYCINLQGCGVINDSAIESQIELLVQQAISNIDQSTIDLIQQELNVNLYILPMNRGDELTEIVEGLLK
ncbi:TPA: hypothetical protein NKP22_000088 [Vibrio parahaemolyticus]|nr:hypothetical protein [Vibrio parahaemolyticus]